MHTQTFLNHLYLFTWLCHQDVNLTANHSRQSWNTTLTIQLGCTGNQSSAPGGGWGGEPQSGAASQVTYVTAILEQNQDSHSLSVFSVAVSSVPVPVSPVIMTHVSVSVSSLIPMPVSVAVLVVGPLLSCSTGIPASFSARLLLPLPLVPSAVSVSVAASVWASCVFSVSVIPMLPAWVVSALPVAKQGSLIATVLFLTLQLLKAVCCCCCCSFYFSLLVMAFIFAVTALTATAAAAAAAVWIWLSFNLHRHLHLLLFLLLLLFLPFGLLGGWNKTERWNMFW